MHNSDINKNKEKQIFNGDITELALIHSLSALKLGKQYVALTQKACDRIKILEEKELSEEERGKLKEASEMNRTAGIAMVNEICRKYRREGRFFDEILKEGEWHDRSEPGKKSAL